MAGNKRRLLKGLYNDRIAELVYNGRLDESKMEKKVDNDNNEKIILMSIISYYAQQIFNGTKKFEFRKSPLKQDDLNQKIYVYSAKKDRAIIGTFRVSEILKGTTEEILKLTGYDKRLDGNEIVDYFGKNNSRCYALKIYDVHKFTKQLSIEELRKVSPNIQFPQYYGYIKNSSPVYNCIKNCESKNSHKEDTATYK